MKHKIILAIATVSSITMGTVAVHDHSNYVKHQTEQTIRVRAEQEAEQEAKAKAEDLRLNALKASNDQCAKLYMEFAVSPRVKNGMPPCIMLDIK